MRGMIVYMLSIRSLPRRQNRDPPPGSPRFAPSPAVRTRRTSSCTQSTAPHPRYHRFCRMARRTPPRPRCQCLSRIWSGLRSVRFRACVAQVLSTRPDNVRRRVSSDVRSVSVQAPPSPQTVLLYGAAYRQEPNLHRVSFSLALSNGKCIPCLAAYCSSVSSNLSTPE